MVATDCHAFLPHFCRFLRQFFIFSQLAIALLACGRSDLPAKGKAAAGAPPSPVVRLAGDQQPAMPASYIVAFAQNSRTHDAPAPRNGIPSPRLAMAAHHNDPRLQRLSFLGEATLAAASHPGRPPQPPSAGFSGLQAAPDEQATQVKLAQLDFENEEAARELLEEWEAAGELLFAEPNELSQLYGRRRPDDGRGGLLSARSVDSLAWGNAASFSLLSHYYEAVGLAWWMEQIQLGPAFSLLGARRDHRPHEDGAAGSGLRHEPPRPARRTASSVGPVVIAVLDSGVDYLHPALQGKIWHNPQPGKAGCTDDEWGCDTTKAGDGELGRGNAYPFLTTQADEPCPSTAISWQCMHGTHVAGILVAEPYPGGGGLCPVCRVLPIKAVELVDGEGKVTDAAILRALQYIRNLNRQFNGLIKVVNSSFGKFQWSRAVALQIAELRREGVLFVAAAGNENSQQAVFPAALQEALAVTAVDASGRKSEYANFGPWVDLAAPGGSLQAGKYASITAPVPGQGLMPSQGTSVATPMVSGVAALLWAIEPGLSVDAVHAILVGSANGKLYESSYGNGYNHYYYDVGRDGQAIPLLGSGLLDAYAALNHTGQSRPAWQQDKRVEPGCGSLILTGGGPTDGGPGAPSMPYRAVWPLVLLLAAPFILLGPRLRRMP